MLQVIPTRYELEVDLQHRLGCMLRNNLVPCLFLQRRAQLLVMAALLRTPYLGKLPGFNMDMVLLVAFGKLPLEGCKFDTNTFFHPVRLREKKKKCPF